MNPPETVILDILDQDGERIRPRIEHKLLGTNVKRDLTWGNQLFYKNKSMIPDLRRKIGTLRLVSKYLDMKSRLKLANGIIISKMIYMINLWGSTRPTWIRKIQIIQNMAARYVTRENRYTRISTLLNK